MSMAKEFKDFATRGNVVDVAVGIIIGGAFGKITSSFVNDVIMPPIGMLMGNVDFTNLFVNLGDGAYTSLSAAEEAGAPIIKYGVFINTLLDFLIVAFAIFMVVKAMNSMKKRKRLRRHRRPNRLRKKPCSRKSGIYWPSRTEVNPIKKPALSSARAGFKLETKRDLLCPQSGLLSATH